MYLSIPKCIHVVWEDIIVIDRDHQRRTISTHPANFSTSQLQMAQKIL